MAVKALLAVTAALAIAVGLLLPGPSLAHKPEPRSSLQTLDIRGS